MKLALALILTAAVLPAQQTTQRTSTQTAAQKPGAVEGVVLNQITGEPIRRAQVRLAPAGPMGRPAAMDMGRGPQGGRAVVTDAEGKFRIEDVQPGEYRLNFQRTGFVASRAGRRAAASVVKIGEGDKVTGIRFTMLPQGVLAGRVIDDEGEPVQGAAVSIVSNRGQRGGGGPGFMAAGINTTNDRGDFRIASVPPGKVVLMVQPRRFNAGPAAVAPFVGGRQSSGYVATYYPGVFDASQATPIEVKPGMEITNLDITLRRTEIFNVKGRALDLDGAPLQRFRVMATSRNNPQSGPAGAGGGAREDGAFEINGLPPGDYNIVVLGAGGRGGRGGGGPMGTGPGQVTGMSTVSVTNRDVEGLVIQLREGFVLTGAIEVQGVEPRPATPNLRVALQAVEAAFFVGGSRPAQVGEDGTFTLANVQPGRYRLASSGATQGLYLASVEINGQELYGKELDLTTGPPGPIKMIYRADGATVSGTVESAESAPQGQVTAVLASADEALREAFDPRTASVDQTGAFQFADLRPGEYLLWVFDDFDRGALADPSFLKTIENKAVKVRAAAAQTATFQTKLTPWPEEY